MKFVIVSLLMIATATLVHGKNVAVTHNVTFEISQRNKPMGSITIGLFGTVVPKTVKNFLAFADVNGYNGMKYIGTKFHRVISQFMVQGGDVSSEQDGRGSYSIYGTFFPDENFELIHSEPGLLSMANQGKDTNGCQFFITTVDTPWLNGKHTVFGKVIDGMDIVRQIERVPTDSNDKPLDDVTITKSLLDEAKLFVDLKQ